jgi:hypothetical protein
VERRGANVERPIATLTVVSSSSANREHAMHHDGSNSARARAARSRTAHDYEANRLESMRRNTADLAEQRRARPSLVHRLASLVGRTPSVLAPELEREPLAGADLTEA